MISTNSFNNIEYKVNISINELVSISKILLTSIKDRSSKETFTKNLIDAVSTNNAEKVRKIFITIGSYIENQEAVSCPKKGKIYKTPPTFLQAGLDFVYELCNDLLNMPNLLEYYSAVEKEAFPDTSDWSKEKKKSLKHKRESKTVDTYVKKDMILVKGDTQSGKEKFTVASSIKSLLESRNPIIITRRITCDADKFERGVNNYSQMFNDYMKKHKVSEQEFQISCIRANDNLKNITTFEPSMIVSLGNESQLSKVLEFAKRFPFKFDLYIDEIDNVDYGEDSQASAVLKELKKLSYQTIGITATPLDSILSEEELKSVNIMRLSRPEDYRGFIDISVKLLIEDETVNALNVKITDYQAILESDKNLEPFLNTFSKSKPEFAWSIKKYIPNICLIKNSRINESQEALFNGIVANYPREFAVVLYNGNGVRIHHHNMLPEILYHKKVIKPNTNLNIDITEALQYLKDNGDFERFPRIIIIAGELAGRCISYVSRDYDWHLTDMYYNPSKTTPIPEMIQSCGRLCGRNRGKSHLHLHCTKRVADALYDGFHFTNEIIERAIASPLLSEEGELSFSKSVKDVPMNKQKFPTGRHITSKVDAKRKDFNLVKNNDNGIDLKNYNYTEIVEKKVEVNENNEDIEESLKQVGEEEFNRLVGMFKKWSTGSSKISMFMQNLDPVKIYTEKEMKELSREHGITNLGQLLSIKVGTNGYGTIIFKKDSTYKLHTCLIEEFNKHF
jgi:hypothetical protein